MSKKGKNKIIITLHSKFPFCNARVIKEEQSHDEITLGINWVMWLWGGLFLLCISILFERFNTHFPGFLYIFNIISEISRDLSIAIISAALIAKIIEVPNFINFINSRTIEALTNHNFLNTLQPLELLDIKKACSKLVFEKNGKREIDQFLNESLIEYESEITKLLMRPYHEYYKINIHCEDVTLKDKDGNSHSFIKKVSKRNFKIVNPLKGTINVDILPAFNMHCPENFECKNLIELNKITVTVDDSQERKDITKLFEPEIVGNGVKHPNYNSRINYYLQPNKNSIYPFNSELVVEIEETRFIAVSDPVYVLRVNKPTKSFSVTYTYNNPKQKLKIEGFGADVNLTDGKTIKTENGSSVSFDMLSWLLPGNGIIIVTIPLEGGVSSVN